MKNDEDFEVKITENKEDFEVKTIEYGSTAKEPYFKLNKEDFETKTVENKEDFEVNESIKTIFSNDENIFVKTYFDHLFQQ